jgi:hypothetical protein
MQSISRTSNSDQKTWQFWINLVSLEASKYVGLEGIESHVNIM